jgi:hypothetical protein
MPREQSGVEELRAAVRLLDNCLEGFNDCLSAEQALALYRAHKASGWDITPDNWTMRQVIETLWGKAPQWSEKQAPLY